MKKSVISNKWITLLVICFGGGIAYIVPYIQFSYYDSLMEGLQLSHAQMGDLMSTLGIASTVCYLLGGLLADKFNVKYLISISLALTGILSFWLASLPSYPELIIIMIFFAFTTILMYWPAMIKAVKMLGSEDEQGRMFGFREAGFGFFALIFTQIGTWFVFKRVEGIEGVQNIIVFYGFIYIIIAAISFIFIPSSSKAKNKAIDGKQVSLINGILYVIKVPSVWFIGLTIFCLYTVYSPGLGKLGPYFTQILGFDETVSASLMSIRMYFIQFIAAASGGIIADKLVGSTTRFVCLSTVCLIISLSIFIILPAKASLIIPIVIIVFIVSAVMYSLTGTYMAPIGETQIPNEYLGTAIGLISFIGYLPDALMWSVFGRMLENNPGEAGFNNIFMTCLALAICGLILSMITAFFIRQRKSGRGDDTVSELAS